MQGKKGPWGLWQTLSLSMDCACSPDVSNRCSWHVWATETMAEEDEGKRCRWIFGKTKDGSFSLPTWIKLISEIGGSCSSCFEPKLETRLTCTVGACKTSGTILSVRMSAALKLRLPRLVFYVRLGWNMPMDYLFVGEPGPCTLQISEEWHRCNSIMLRKGIWGILHIYNPCEQ